MDALAFEKALPSVARQLREFAFGHLRLRKDDAYDLVQTAIMKLWESREKIKPRTFGSYAVVVALNLYRDQKRLKRPITHSLDEVIGGEHDDLHGLDTLVDESPPKPDDIPHWMFLSSGAIDRLEDLGYITPPWEEEYPTWLRTGRWKTR